MCNTWLMPCNPNFFDIISHFEKNDEMLWKGVSSTAIDDTVYLYIGRPYSEIRYMCKVVETWIDKDIVEESNFDLIKKDTINRKNIIRIKKVKAFPAGKLPYNDLIKHGLVSVQSQMRVSKELSDYIIVTCGIGD